MTETDEMSMNEPCMAEAKKTAVVMMLFAGFDDEAVAGMVAETTAEQVAEVRAWQESLPVTHSAPKVRDEDSGSGLRIGAVLHGR